MLVENIITEKGIVERDKVKIAIERLKAFEPAEGYYLCFSGGKDSQCIYHLAKEGDIKFDAHYSHTGIDAPELVRFIRDKYLDVISEMPKESMFKLIEKKGLPTRMKRWCCSSLKERGGEGRSCVTGIRWEESNSRAKRKPFEVVTPKFSDRNLFNDNDEDRRLFETCVKKGKRVINPIIDWTELEVWEYLNSRNIDHCCLYDQGYKRIGCIGCPLATSESMIKDFERYPTYLKGYKKAFDKFIVGYFERCEVRGIIPKFTTTEEFFNWWINGNVSDDNYENQIEMEGD